MRAEIAMLTLTMFVTACSGGDAAGELPHTERVAQDQTGSTTDLCRRFMQRQRACSDVFIPALVAARLARDTPPGIAAADAQNGREALLREALAEWAEDSKDEAIGKLCHDIARSISPARETELRASAGACLATPSCEHFAACAVPVSLERWQQ